MSAADAPGLGSGRAYEAARLRWAGEGDAARLATLWRAAHEDEDALAQGEDAAGMRGWLEHGGARMLEDGQGRLLCAARWCWGGEGWRGDRNATLPEARGQGFGRWLMTKLEALAIKRNIPTLTLTLAKPELVPYYRRMGYREDGRAGAQVVLVKQVGGTWQRHPGSAP